MSTEANSRTLYENLDTSFVNLWALLRFLSQRGFVGRVHVELKDYTADVFVNDSSTPLVHEVDHATGADVLEEAALHRLVLRARESDGSITVFEGADEAVPPQASQPVVPAPLKQSSALEGETEQFELVSEDGSEEAPLQATANEPVSEAPIGTEQTGAPQSKTADETTEVKMDQPPQVETEDLVKVSGPLIAAVERALNASGANFDALFTGARLRLADDYSFLDPTASGFGYADGTVTMGEEPGDPAYIGGLSEALRRVVEEAANGERGGRLRERVGLELALVARKNPALTRSGFRTQLDRIAGTRVI